MAWLFGTVQGVVECWTCPQVTDAALVQKSNERGGIGESTYFHVKVSKVPWSPIKGNF